MKFSYILYFCSLLFDYYYRGGDLNYIKKEKDPSADGLAAAHLACAAGSLDTVKWLLSRGANMNIKSGRLNRTPLMFAAKNNHIRVVLYLLEHGIMPFINDQDVAGEAALHFAACQANPDLAQVSLLQNPFQFSFLSIFFTFF